MDITNIRLRSQQLIETNFKTPKELVAWMGAMQAQNYNMLKWAIGMRLPGFTDTQVEEAFNRGEILRTHVMRPTWHLVSAEDIRWILPLSAERIKSAMISPNKILELTEEVYAKVHKIIEKALAGNKHLTRDELTEELERANVSITPSRIYHIMMRAEVDGLVCSGAIRGNQQTYALLDERISPTKALLKDEALAKLAFTYFRSHSPATLQDFIWWSGLPTAEAKHALEMVKSDFVSEVIDSQIYWVHNSFQDLPSNDESILLLPAFDEYLISYKDRKAMLAAEHHSKAITSNGIFRPTILKNGKVIGTWKKATTKHKTIIPDFFENPDPSTLESIDKTLLTLNSWFL